METYSDTMEPGALVLIVQFNRFLHSFLVFLVITFVDTSWLSLMENDRDPLIREEFSIASRHFFVVFWPGGI